MLISTALLLDSIIRLSVCTPAKLPCRRVEVGYDLLLVVEEDNDLDLSNSFPKNLVTLLLSIIYFFTSLTREENFHYL
jgi:hypothetical protein